MKPSEQLAVLGMSMGLMALMQGRIEHGRLKGLVQKLKLQAIKATFKSFGRWSSEISDTSSAIIFEFGKRSGWEGAKISLPMYANFNLLLLEESPFPGLIEISEDIVDYFSRAGEDSHGDYDNAVRYYSIWLDVVSELGG